jgi:DNA repair exonuclease SbcCD ATPase subunit
MNDAVKEFELLKKLIVVRLSTVLEPPPLAVLLSAFDDYQHGLAEVLSRYEKDKTNLKAENDILRSLAGANDAETTAKMLQQGEELCFVRGRLLAAVEELKAAKNGADTLRLELEAAKNEMKKARLLREEDRQRFQGEVEALAEKLKTFEQKMMDQQVTFENEKAKILRECRDRQGGAPGTIA